MPDFAKAVVSIARGRLQSVTVNGQDLGYIGRLRLVVTPDHFARLTVELLADVEVHGDVVLNADVPFHVVADPPPPED